MKISRKADYAIRAVLYIARQPKDKRNPINEIAESEGIPRDFLAKILKELTRAEILKSYQGVHGGYQLARNAKQISLLNIIEKMDGPLGLALCMREGEAGKARYDSHAVMSSFFSKLQKDVKAQLKGAAVSRLASARGRK